MTVQGLEAIDGTPVIDIKPVLDQSNDSRQLTAAAAEAPASNPGRPRPGCARAATSRPGNGHLPRRGAINSGTAA